MRSKRLVLVAVAVGAGLLAAMLLVNAMRQKPVEQKVITKVEEIPSEEVLVASTDLPIGKMISGSELEWQKWPQKGLSGNYITRTARPQAIEELSGTITRSPFLSGEPIKERKLIRSDRGFMSAILPKGQRAIAVQVSALNTAGGFVLPNDRVDVILTRQRGNGNRQDWYSETILENVRVLAIDQTIEDREGEKAVVGRETATLELNPQEAEIIAQSQQLGSISLALRSIADSEPDSEAVAVKKKRGSGVSYVKYGVQTQSTTSQ